MAEGLYDRPDLYDLIAPADPEMEGFYVETAKRLGPRVLDLACGTGRFSLALASAGLDVTAGDLSPTMLGEAHRRAAARGLDLAFHQLDMRDFDLGVAPFDTVTIAANSVLHLRTHEDFAGFFSSVARHLAPHGRLLFDAFVPSLRLLSSDPQQRHLVGRFAHPDLGEVTLEETIRYDPIPQVSHADWYWSRNGAEFWTMALEMRQIFPQELPLLPPLGGMRLVERYGDFAGGPLTAVSFRQVCVCALAD